MPDSNNAVATGSSSEAPQYIGHYRILRRLGKGGMGEIFLAEDTKQHDRKVALKVLPTDLTTDEARLRRFKQEAKAVLALNHPNILTVFEIGEVNAINYIATEFIEGETLRQCLWRDRLEIDEALGIGIQIAMALEAAHAAGIVHRDIKPENIMLRQDRFVRDRLLKVLDFGLAKLTEREPPFSNAEAVTVPVDTNPGTIIGTTGYMSPEQAQGQAIDSRSDIFSLGVVLYEMVAGRAPFTGPTDSHIRVSIIDHDPLPLTQYAQVPRQLERIVSKALAKDKAKRYQTITDFKLDLEQLRDELYRSGSSIHDGTSAKVAAHLTRQNRVVLSQEQRLSGLNTLSNEGIPTVSTELQSFKQFSAIKTAPTLVIAIAAAALITAFFYFRSITPAITSVAVLPFINDSGDHNAEYLSDGITESIIRSLSQLPRLKVMSRNAVFRFKGKGIDPQEVGRNLKVGAVLVGRLVKFGNQLMIKTELINVTDGSQLWGAEYNNNIADLFSVQDQISRKISDKLRLRLTGEDEEKLTKRYTMDAEAYELYLKGRYFWNKRDEPGLRNGINYFKAAEEKDPNYALAYSGLADSYALLCDIGVVRPADEMPKAKAAAQRAVDIDPALAEGYTSRAFVKLAYDWDWPGAESDFRQAMELNPKYPTAHQWYASYLAQMGKFERATQEIEQAQQLDPLSPIISSNAGFYSYLQHHYDEAIEQYKKTIEIDPGFWVAHHYLGLAYTKKGVHEQGFKELRLRLDQMVEGPVKPGSVEKDPEVAASLAFSYADAGKRVEAEGILARLKLLAQQRYVSPLYLAIVYTGLKQNDQAMEYLGKALESRHPGLVLIRVDPIFDNLHGDERFKQLVKQFEPIP